MRKIRVLLIAPYAEMADLAKKVASERTDIFLDIQIGDLSDGLKIASSLHQNYDIIISRGGTAQLVESRLNIPLIPIEISGYDMVRLIQLVNIYEGKSAVVGFSDITKPAKLICDLLQYKNDIITIQNKEEIEGCILSLKEKGYGLIIGDVIATKTASKYGLKTILATSGPESISKAYDDAVHFMQMVEKTQKEDSYFKDALLLSGTLSAITDLKGNILFSTFPIGSNLVEQLKAGIPYTLRKNYTQMFIHSDKSAYRLIGKKIPDLKDACYFQLIPIINDADFKKNEALTVMNPGDANITSLNSFVGNSPAMQRLLGMAYRCSQSMLPVMIIGKQNTGKRDLAYAIHWDSQLANSPIISIDLQKMTNKIWNQLFERENSPLTGDRCTLFLSGIQFLSQEIQVELYDYINSTELWKRFRILSTSTFTLEEMLGSPLFYSPLIERLSTICLRMPELSERKEDIQSLVGLYISEYNLEFGKHIVGFEAGALTQLQNFFWPYNLAQLRNLVCKLVLLTDGPNISAQTVSTVLSESSQCCSDKREISLKGTLEEIEQECIRSVLIDENMNQTKAAQRLGISRTTMWRKAKLKPTK